MTHSHESKKEPRFPVILTKEAYNLVSEVSSTVHKVRLTEEPFAVSIMSQETISNLERFAHKGENVSQVLIRLVHTLWGVREGYDKAQ